MANINDFFRNTYSALGLYDEDTHDGSDREYLP
jgi:hypothetical protein